MGFNELSSSERIHIAFFGAVNSGKSSLINAITNQEISLVSEIPGTTVDPVKKSMELMPIGQVCIIDTPGIGDEVEMSESRIERLYDILDKTDIAILVSDAMGSLKQTIAESKLKEMFREKNVPYIIIQNKIDLVPDNIKAMIKAEVLDNEILLSTVTGENIDLLKEKIAILAPKKQKVKKLISDFVDTGDTVIVVTSDTEYAKRGSLAMPSQMIIREILDLRAVSIVCGVRQLKSILDNLKDKPKLVISDMKAIEEVDKMVTYDIPLTSIDILLDRYKGTLEMAIKGAKALSMVKDGDKILIYEGCMQHRQYAGDICGQIQRWIEKQYNVKPNFDYISGSSFVSKPENYKMIIHCNGCMLGDKERLSRLTDCDSMGVPILTYDVVN